MYTAEKNGGKAVDKREKICYTTRNRIAKAMKEKAGSPSDAESRRLLKAGEDALPMLWLPSRALNRKQ